jgi:hypothetical protein
MTLQCVGHTVLLVMPLHLRLHCRREKRAKFAATADASGTNASTRCSEYISQIGEAGRLKIAYGTE